MLLVDLENISRSYGPLRLNNVSLPLEPGTIGLVGNNGAGKSTLLKVLLGIAQEARYRAAARSWGADLAQAGAELRGRIGYMPEAAATVPLLKGVEFAASGRSVRHAAPRCPRRRAHEVLNYVGLGDSYRRLEEYSTGNLQRLSWPPPWYTIHNCCCSTSRPTASIRPDGSQCSNC